MTTTTTHRKLSSAEVKVIAVNQLNKWAATFYAFEKAHFSKFIGIDIFKVDGSIKQKFAHDKIDYKGQLPDGTHVNAHYWFENRHGYFDIRVKICISGGSYDVKPTTYFCQYEDMGITLFKTEDGKLTESDTDISHLNKKYDVTELQAIAEEIKEAAKVYEAAANKMPYIFKDVFDIERLSR